MTDDILRPIVLVLLGAVAVGAMVFGIGVLYIHAVDQRQSEYRQPINSESI